MTSAPDIRLVRRTWLVSTFAVWLLSAGGSSGVAIDRPFREVAERTGVKFTHDNGSRGEFHLPEIMGSGVALLDYDGDRDLDVYLVQGAPVEDSGGTPPVGAGTSRLFRNDLDKGEATGFRFTDVTDTAGVGHRGVGMGAAVGDYDGDGRPDLYVTSFGSNVLYRNNGDGTFTDVTKRANADDPRWSTSSAFLDYDRDGDMDLFIANYVDFTVAARKVCADPVGTRDYCSPSAYRPVPSRVLRNNGNGTFTDATDAAGVSRAYGAGLGVAVGDYNGDRWLDIYVANDATPSQLWINRQNGTFEDQGWLSGTAVNAAGRPEGSMGIASGDYDADGDEDLVVTNLVGETHVLYESDGRGNFDDRRAAVGLAGPTATMTGFGTAWLDYDSDAWLDLMIVNGAVNIIPALRGTASAYAQRNQLFHNDGRGRLREVSAESGPAFEMAEVSRGLAVGDIDNDGDLDAMVTNNAGPVRLLLNEAKPGGWLGVGLEATSGNRLGFGARVGVVRRGLPTLWRRVGSDGSYLSASDSRVHFGLGAAAEIDRIVVEWVDGMTESWPGPKANRHVTLKRGTGTREGER